MYRQDFINNINDWSDLLQVCYDEGCDINDDIFSQDDRDDYVNNHLSDIADGHRSWRDLRDVLNSIEDDCDWYVEETYYDGWAEADDELFEERKASVLCWMDDGCCWDEEDDDEDDDEDEYANIEPDNHIDDSAPIEDEDIALMDLLSMCNDGLKLIAKEQEAAERQRDEDLKHLTDGFSILASGA